jgi:hypothetical protein
MHGQDKTPTPVLYSEHLIAGSTIIDGFLVTTNEDGSITPEIGAYIYIYVNNILINEDNRTITSGEGRAGVVTVVQEPQSNTNPRFGLILLGIGVLIVGRWLMVLML